MQYKYVTYTTANNFIFFENNRKKLPDRIKDEFIKDTRLNDGDPWVEAGKTEVIKHLDNIFNIGKTKDVYKHVHIEIDKSEIPNFTHFEILPRPLEWDREIFCNIIRPTCGQDSCPMGAKIVFPIRISAKKSKKIGIAEIGRPWGNQRELIISPMLKRIFDSEGITGLEYKRCVLDDRKTLNTPEGTPPYLARIVHSTGEFADDILVRHYYCEKHCIPSSFYPFNLITPREILSDYDFQTVNTVTVKGKEYNYYKPHLIISRRVLQLLLKHKIRGLTDQCVFLNEKFIPLIYLHRPLIKLSLDFGYCLTRPIKSNLGGITP